ncbi:MAG: RHS repeat-associated core domain-containing protein [Chloroflexota bacterium]
MSVGFYQALADDIGTYLYGLGRIAQQGESSTGYFLGDALGSVRQLVDGDGVVTLARGYEPYGVVLGSSGSGVSDFGFAGEAQDARLIYLRGRYYSQGTGRFTQIDPTRLEANLYLYAAANPLRFVDPSGFYSRSKAKQYALDWAAQIDPPPGHYNFLQGGQRWSDCADFASQTLWAGGIVDPRHSLTDPKIIRIDEGTDEIMIPWIKKLRYRLGLGPGAYFWNYNVWEEEELGGWKSFMYYSTQTDYQYSAKLHLEEWYQTDPLLSFLKNNYLGTALPAYSGTIPSFAGNARTNGTFQDDDAWVSYLEKYHNNIQPGDLVFYDYLDAPLNGNPWDHVAVVVGWGTQTYYGLGYQPKNECQTEIKKPRVVDRGRGRLGYYQDWGDTRSIDNVPHIISQILILHVNDSAPGQQPLWRQSGN